MYRITKLKFIAAIAAPALLAGCFDAHLHGKVGETEVNLALKGDSEIQGITIAPVTKKAAEEAENLCRQVNVSDGYLRIRGSSSNRAEVGRLYPGGTVTLVSTAGYDGFVEITSPQSGFVSARYLSPC